MSTPQRPQIWPRILIGLSIIAMIGLDAMWIYGCRLAVFPLPLFLSIGVIWSVAAATALQNRARRQAAAQMEADRRLLLATLLYRQQHPF